MQKSKQVEIKGAIKDQNINSNNEVEEEKRTHDGKILQQQAHPITVLSKLPTPAHSFLLRSSSARGSLPLSTSSIRSGLYRVAKTLVAGKIRSFNPTICPFCGHLARKNESKGNGCGLVLCHVNLASGTRGAGSRGRKEQPYLTLRQ